MRAAPQGKDGSSKGAQEQGSVQIWRISLDLDPTRRARLASTLSAEEQARAGSLRFEAHRHRFIVAHGALRAILGARLERDPTDLELTADPGGKPRIRREEGAIDLRFSLSHSHDLALVAVAIAREVGVDVEKIDQRTRVLQLARRYFAPEEVAVLEILSPPARTEEFFRYWTLKEAYLKALGIGLREPLDSFAVSPATAAPPHILWSARGDAASWTLHTLAPAERYQGAVVVEGSTGRLETREWPTDLRRPTADRSPG